MSQPKRYGIVCDFKAPWSKMHEFEKGEWVQYSDYAALAAENEARKMASAEVAAAFLALPAPHNQVGRIADGISSLTADFAALAAENERLKEAWVDKKMQEDRDYLAAENERLRKAGDWMSNLLGNDYKGYPVPSVAAWLAAKEGRDVK